MTIVRDLLINFGAKLDDGSVKNVDNQVKGMANRTSNAMETATALLTADMMRRFVTGVFSGLFALNEMASDVEENMNVINESFGEYAGDIIGWSEQFGAAAGRNKYELQQMAAVIGSTVNPMMDRNTYAAAEMSTRLAQLAVDLGSFYNAADSQVMNALRSGITGEAEPLKRFGIVMNEATLSAFALSEGIKGNIKDMSIAEKTTLRYNFIMAQTITAQGDAARTSLGWANAKKALIGQLTELATTAGLKILPIFTKMVNYARSIASAFAQAVKGTHFFESALASLAVVALAVGLKLLIAFAPVIIPILKMAALFGLLVLAVEDFYTFLQGGDSLIGRFIDSVWGPGSATAALAALKQGFQTVSDFVTEVFWPWLQKSGPKIKLFAQAAGHAFIEVAKYVREFFGVLNDYFDWLVDTAIPEIIDFVKWLDRVWNSEALGAVVNISGKPGSRGADGADGKPQGSRGRFASGVTTFNLPSIKGAGGQPVTVNNNTTVNVSANNTSAALAGDVADRTADSMSSLQQRTAAALTRRY